MEGCCNQTEQVVDADRSTFSVPPMTPWHSPGGAASKLPDDVQQTANQCRPQPHKARSVCPDREIRRIALLSFSKYLPPAVYWHCDEKGWSKGRKGHLVVVVGGEGGRGHMGDNQAFTVMIQRQHLG